MHKKIFAYLLCIGSFILLAFILFNQMINSRRSPTAVYSWDTVQVENPDDTVSTLISLDIDDIYQYASEAYLNEPVYLDNIIAFIQKTEQANKWVYLLNDEPEWAMDPDARELIQYINTVDELNQSLPKDQQIKGIVIDIEPQSLPEFESNPDLLMRHFTEGLTAAHQVANQKGLEVIVCLPYFFDTEGFSDELATIVQRASDQVAIMNYYRGKEIDHISNEASLSKQYHKPIQTIYELQAPGQFDLAEINTYHHLSLDAVVENFNQLKTHFSDQQVNLGLHEYKSLVKLLE